MSTRIKGNRTSEAGRDGHESLALLIARSLVREITSNAIPVNSRLPGEVDLAQRFAASRASIREALSALQFAGYIESRKGSGSVVVSSDPLGHRDSFHGRDRMPADDLQLLEARLVLEPNVVALAARDPDRSALRAARQLIDGMGLAVRDPDLRANTDLRLHAAIVEACRNNYLVGECRRLIEASASPYYHRARQYAWGDSSLLKHWVEDHTRLVSAIVAGEPEEAAACSRQHLLSVVEHMSHDDSYSITDRVRLNEIAERFANR